MVNKRLDAFDQPEASGQPAGQTETSHRGSVQTEALHQTETQEREAK